MVTLCCQERQRLVDLVQGDLAGFRQAEVRVERIIHPIAPTTCTGASISKVISILPRLFPTITMELSSWSNLPFPILRGLEICSSVVSFAVSVILNGSFFLRCKPLIATPSPPGAFSPCRVALAGPE